MLITTQKEDFDFMVKLYIGDNFLIRRELETLRNERKDSINFREVSEFGIEEVSFLNSPSFFVDDRRVLIYSTTKLSANSDLLMAVSDCNDEYDLIIICDSVDKRSKVYTELCKQGVVENYELNLSRISSLIRDEMNSLGVGITESDIRYITNRCGADLGLPVSGRDIVSWCNFLALANAPITPALIDTVVPEQRNNNIWALKDALIARDSSSVMEIADVLIKEDKNCGIPVLSAMVTDFRVAYKLAVFSDDRSVNASSLGVKRVPRSCMQYSQKQLSAALDLLISGIATLKKEGNTPILFKSILANVLCTLKN